MIRSRLLQYPFVQFSGYKVPHPLEAYVTSRFCPTQPSRSMAGILLFPGRLIFHSYMNPLTFSPSTKTFWLWLRGSKPALSSSLRSFVSPVYYYSLTLQNRKFILRIQTDGSVTPRAALIQTCRDLVHDLALLNQEFTKEWELRKMVGDASSGAANTNTAGEGPSGGAEWMGLWRYVGFDLRERKCGEKREYEEIVKTSRRILHF